MSISTQNYTYLAMQHTHKMSIKTPNCSVSNCSCGNLHFYHSHWLLSHTQHAYFPLRLHLFKQNLTTASYTLSTIYY